MKNQNEKSQKIKENINPPSVNKENAKKEEKKCMNEEKENKKEEECKKKDEEINALKAKLSAEKDDYVRLMAEFETFRRRTAEDRLSLINSAASDTIKGLLPVLDDFERAINMLKNSEDKAAKEGTSLIYNKLISYLKTKGLEAIEAKGEKFDTDLHEAVAQVPVEEKSKKGLVFDVVSTGYKLNGKILRFAKVVVGI